MPPRLDGSCRGRWRLGTSQLRYVLAAFYEVWACADTQNRGFWQSAVTKAREFFPKTCHSTTGLAPYLANYDGSPLGGTQGDFDSDAESVPPRTATSSLGRSVGRRSRLENSGMALALRR